MISFLKFAMIIEQKNSLDVSLDSEKDYDNNIYYYILSALLGGRSIYIYIKKKKKKLKMMMWNKDSELTIFLNKVQLSSMIPYLICRSFFFLD